MKPNYQIILTSDGTDLTPIYNDRLLNLQIDDETGEDNDVLTLEFDNEDFKLPTPRYGAQYTIRLGYDNNLRTIGSYILEEYEFNGSNTGGHTIKIRCTGESLDEPHRDEQRRLFTGPGYTKVIQILDKVAEESGYKVVTVPELGEINIDKEYQVNMSNAVFLQQLAKHYDAVSTIKNGTLYFLPRGTKINQNGQSISKVYLTQDDILSYAFTHTPQERAARVTAKWQEDDKINTAVVGSGDGRQPSLPDIYDTRSKAIEASKTFLKDQARLGKNITLALIGNQYIHAGCVIVISGLPSAINGEWTIAKASHKYDRRGGYVTECSTEEDEAESETEYDEIPEDDGIDEPDI
jgi:uncharacterized protein